MNNKVMTVRGEIGPEQLGKCLIHQHVLFGYPGWQGAVRTFDHEEAMAYVLEILNEAKKRHGLTTVVDATPADCGRDVEFLKDVSERSGIHIIASSGYYYEGEGATGYFKLRSMVGDAPKEIYEMMKKEVTVGVGNTGIRTGVIKVATSADEITSYEDMFLRAAGRVSAETGVKIITHTQSGKLGAEQVRRLVSYGAEADCIMVGHLDGCADMDTLMEIFELGAYGGFDRLGLQNMAGVIPESRRLALIVGLAASGYGKRIMLAHDSFGWLTGEPCIYTEQQKKDLANWNWVHVFENIVPTLKRMGVPEKMADAMVEANPQMFLCR